MADFREPAGHRACRADDRRFAWSTVEREGFTASFQQIALIAILAIVWTGLPRLDATRPESSEEPAILTFVVVNGTVKQTEPAPGAADYPLPPLELAEANWLIPVLGVSPNDLTDSYHSLREGSRRHRAIDISAPLNTPIVAPEAGIIAKLQESALGGLSIYQYDSSSNYVYYYAHLHRYSKGLEEGKTVRKGEVIGYVGQTGNAQTPHLHFAVAQLSPDDSWWGGKPVNPYPLLKLPAN
jgi:peptidoglycan LD-endopeptidase LytH